MNKFLAVPEEPEPLQPVEGDEERDAKRVNLIRKTPFSYRIVCHNLEQCC